MLTQSNSINHCDENIVILRKKDNHAYLEVERR